MKKKKKVQKRVRGLFEIVLDNNEIKYMKADSRFAVESQVKIRFGHRWVSISEV